MAYEKSRNIFKGHTKNKKNPYSDRGLDKFSALLTNLEEKRKQIYSQNHPKNIVLIRFTYKNSDECVPLVVKQRNKKQDKQLVIADSEEPIKQDDDNKSLVRVTKSRRLRKPLCYVSAVVILILILFLLCVFSRFVTVLWVCVLWYLVPCFETEFVRIKKIQEL